MNSEVQVSKDYLEILLDLCFEAKRIATFNEESNPVVVTGKSCQIISLIIFDLSFS